MHHHRRPLASRFLSALAATGLLFLAGCSTPLTNLTPGELPANPSQLYTLSVRFTPRAAKVVPGSIEVIMVIDGQPHPMTKSEAGKDIYLYDFPAAPGTSEIAYYVLGRYQSSDIKGTVTAHEDFSPLQHGKISGRYLLSLETNRGPVGARIGILGRGFTAQDTVSLDGTPARTVYESPNALAFYVPSVEGGRNYKVQISNATGSAVAGTFRVDASTVSINPTALTLRAGEAQLLTFTVPVVATAGGRLLDVTTNVPDSVIMPEVFVPAGSNSVTVTVTGGRPGSGTLTLSGFGASDVTIPVTVTP